MTRRSAELLVRIHEILSGITIADEPLDDLSRLILIQIAAAHESKRAIRITDVVAQQKPVTAPTTYKRIRQLIERGLVNTEPCPQDGRSVLLTLTPESRKLIEKVARSIRQACESQA